MIRLIQVRQLPVFIIIQYQSKKSIVMSTQEEELHTKFKLLLSGQGYVKQGVICISNWSPAPKKKHSPFRKLFTTHTLVSLFNVVSPIGKLKK